MNIDTVASKGCRKTPPATPRDQLIPPAALRDAAAQHDPSTSKFGSLASHRTPSAMAFDLSLESIKERKHKDGIFGIVYGLITLFVVGVTISHAPHASKVINDISGCPGNPSGNAMHQLRHAAPDLAPPLGDPSEDFFVEDLIHSLPYAGLMPIPCAIVIGVVWMFLLYKFALPIVYGTLILAGAILVGVGGMLFIESSNPAPLLLTAVGLLYWSFLWCWRSRIQLTAKLIEQAVVVSAAKPGIFGASAFLLVIKILSVLLCFST